MADFFEQLRQPLRQQDSSGAAEIVFVLCDGRLPRGVNLPSEDFDYSMLMIEEAFPGDMVLF